MERIYLSNFEKLVFLHVQENGGKVPRNITLVMFHYCLSTLREKGLVEFKVNYDEVIRAGLTVKGAAYLEQNPKLRNPVDWKWLVTTILVAITAVATTLALFVACNRF